MNNEITLNSLEHYMFCPYQWWLIYVENEWVDNTHTILGDILHTKVDDPNFIEKRGDLRIERSVPLYSDELNLYGIADLIEFHYQNDILKSITIVEYKKGIPTEDKQTQVFDGLQLYAQMYCAKEIYKCEVKGCIYYGSIRKRVFINKLDFYDKLLKDTLNDMRSFFAQKTLPLKNKGKHCNACSLKEICLPFAGVKCVNC